MKKLLATISSILLSSILMIPANAASFGAAENLIIEGIIGVENPEDLDVQFLDDNYLAGANAVIDTDVIGDLWVAGGSVNVNGNIEGDLVVVGGRVLVTGNVSDDLRVAGGDVILTGNVGDDLIAAGGKIDIANDVSIGGDLAIGTGYVTIDGNIAGNVNGGSGMFILNGSVAGDVVVSVEEKVEISENASIGGDLKYSALVEMVIPENVVAGEIVFNQFQKEEQDLEKLTEAFVIYRVINYFSLLLLALILAAVMPKGLIKTAEIMKKQPFQTFGIGITTVIAGFVGSLILIATLIGMPLGIIALVSLFIVMYISRIFVAVWIASYVVNFAKQKKYQRVIVFLAIAAGLIVYYLVSYIPFIGWLIGLVVFLMGVGAIVLQEIEYIKFLKKKGEL